MHKYEDQEYERRTGGSTQQNQQDQNQQDQTRSQQDQNQSNTDDLKRKWNSEEE